MHMWFWFGDNLGSFLLPGYNVVTTPSFICTCVGLTALAILYEGMKILQIKIQQNNVIRMQEKRAGTSENSSLLSKLSSRSIGKQFSLQCMSWSMWCLQVFHWFIHTLFGYILMLAIMTYNVYVNIAIILGGCIGYWIFGPKLIELNLARFHKRQKLLNCDEECAGDNIINQGPESTVSVVTEQLVTEATVEVHVPRDA
ncbi:PREDICTED: probable low affinity copper uptake protein 2 [Dufourea novaeangliae]|uniref:Copper transport protein n=1 Tax=Dufourea novaeangliae TaxID=178035 RepID=A0A154PI13_DUFNO|nr:PREDICTED: probable low affinity copper uptake protein 2 [Dufourea novaeangliae]KZC11501.1 High affinity copper uptake protein 1 [Dufourea novaeangliae]